MFRTSRGARGTSAGIGNLNPRWRTVIMALILALGMGSAGQSALAQDGGATPVKINTIMLTSMTPQEICIGDSGTIRVQVIRERTAISSIPGFVKPQREQRMVTVNASIADTSVASFINEQRQVISNDSDVPGQVSFVIHGDKEGSTQAVIKTEQIERLPDETFDNASGGFFVADTITRTVPLKVTNCEYKVNLISDWTFHGEARIHVRAEIDGAELKRKEAEGALGNDEYDSLAEVKWKIEVSNFEDCEFEKDKDKVEKTGQVNIQGKKDNNGARLVVTLIFDPVTVSLKGKCKRGGEQTKEINFDVDMTAEKLRLTVPSDVGGGSSQTQDLDAQYETTTGGAFIQVYPANALQ